MKKILSLTLATAIGLGSMNMQAAKANSPRPNHHVVKTFSDGSVLYRKNAGMRAYVGPALQCGVGLAEIASAFSIHSVTLPWIPRGEKIIKTPFIEIKYRNGCGGMLTPVLIFALAFNGMQNVIKGWNKMKRVRAERNSVFYRENK